MTAAVVGAALAAAIGALSLTATFETFEWRTLDVRYGYRPTRPVRSDLIIVFIGDDSIRQFGRWPWPWEYHALLVDILKRHGAKDVIFDILFADAPQKEGIETLSLALKISGNVYLSAYFNELNKDDAARIQVGSLLTEPLAELKGKARGVGHCNALPDGDGITRRIPLMVRYKENYYPSTALQVVLDRLNASLADVTVAPGKHIRVPRPNGGDIFIPLDGDGLTMIDFAGDLNSFEAYSFLQVLQSDRFPETAPIDLKRFRDKTVLVGVTFAGNTDLRPTPLSTAYPMLCILGNAVDNILQGDFIRRPSILWRFAGFLLLGGLCGLLFYTFRPVVSSTAALALMAMIGGGSIMLFNRFGFWLDVVAPVTIILIIYLTATTAQYIRNRREKMRYLEYLKFMDDLVETTTDAIISMDLEGKIITWNRGAEIIFRLPLGDVVGRSWHQLAAESEHERLESALGQVRRKRLPLSIEFRGRRGGGEEFPSGGTFSPVESSTGEFVAISCIVQDLTERKKMVAMLIEAEKMAELGRLGSGIVHEIKNPLTSIMMLTGMVIQNQALDPKAAKYLSIIDQEAQRILRLSQNILSFARPKKAEMRPMDLNEILRETLSLVEYELKKNKIVLALNLAEGGVAAMVDGEKMKQVFLNLIINAAHAMSGGGALAISTLRGEGVLHPPPPGYLSRTVGQIPAGTVAVAAIQDKGCGIDQPSLEHIFDAFYTTKEEGKGTGLGLYISRNIILEHQAAVRVSSRVAEGTEFVVIMPATTAKVSSDAAASL